MSKTSYEHAQHLGKSPSSEHEQFSNVSDDRPGFSVLGGDGLESCSSCTTLSSATGRMDLGADGLRTCSSCTTSSSSVARSAQAVADTPTDRVQPLDFNVAYSKRDGGLAFMGGLGCARRVP